MNTNYPKSDDFAGSRESSKISVGTVIKGEISSPNDLRIDGTFIGKVTSEAKVTIGDKAEIKGDIVCHDADIWGHVEGDVYAKDTLALKETCVINGDLHIRRLAVELDAKFEGNCKMITEEDFNNLTSGEKPAMYDVPEEPVAEPAVEEIYTPEPSYQPETPFPAEEAPAVSSSSPFAIPANDNYPEA